MSDTSQGPGWWMASDGRWYPPEANPSRPPPPPPPMPPPPAGPMMYAPPEVGTAAGPGPAPSPYPPSPVDEGAKRRRFAAYVVGAGAALMVGGSFLPWVKLNAFFITISRSGVDAGDGWISVILGGLLAVVAWRLVAGAARRPTAPVVLAILLSLGAAGLAVFEWVDIENATNDISSEAGLDEGIGDAFDFGTLVSKGMGIYVVGIGGLVGVAGAIGFLRAPKPA